jgi:hypothetical protein
MLMEYGVKTVAFQTYHEGGSTPAGCEYADNPRVEPIAAQYTYKHRPIFRRRCDVVVPIGLLTSLLLSYTMAIDMSNIHYAVS